MAFLNFKNSLAKKIIFFTALIIFVIGIFATFLVYYLIRTSLAEKNIPANSVTTEQTQRENLAPAANIENANFPVIRSGNENTSSASANRVAIEGSIGVFLAASLANIIIGLLLHEFFKPLTKLKNFTGEISKGNFKQRLELTTHDEFEDLANVLNTMAGRLDDMYIKINQEVDQKTKELQKFQMAINNASDHIVITDPEGVILYMNPAAEKITGFSIRESVGKKVASKELWGGLMTKGFYDNLWKTVKTERRAFEGNLTNKRKNGESYEAEVKIFPILNDKNELTFFVAIERDVTRAREIDRAKTEFVSLASHQLRTPLTAIKWHIEMLINEDMGKMKPEQKESLQEVYHSNERMIDLVNSLLNTSRIDMGTFAVDPIETNVVLLIDDVLREMTNSIAMKKIKIQKTYEDSMLMLSVDPMLLRIVLQNLFSNAVKYTPDSGKINISIKKEENELLFSVADTGYGIPQKQQRKIFTKLFRADNAKELDSDGSGLGLYVTKAVVEQAGGKIWFESEEKKGTTFYFTILKTGMKRKEGTKALSQLPI